MVCYKTCAQNLTKLRTKSMDKGHVLVVAIVLACLCDNTKTQNTFAATKPINSSPDDVGTSNDTLMLTKVNSTSVNNSESTNITSSPTSATGNSSVVNGSTTTPATQSNSTMATTTQMVTGDENTTTVAAQSPNATTPSSTATPIPSNSTSVSTTEQMPNATTTFTLATTAQQAANSTLNNTSSTPEGGVFPQGNVLSPGLVAVICIFVAVLAIFLVVIVVKFCQRDQPAFKRLDDLPMNNMNEESPFAHYPPK